jgi:hypothetical protein
LHGRQAWQPQLDLLQTIPGIDIDGAAMLLVEIGAGGVVQVECGGGRSG